MWNRSSPERSLLLVVPDVAAVDGVHLFESPANAPPPAGLALVAGGPVGVEFLDEVAFAGLSNVVEVCQCPAHRDAAGLHEALGPARDVERVEIGEVLARPNVRFVERRRRRVVEPGLDFPIELLA